MTAAKILKEQAKENQSHWIAVVLDEFNRYYIYPIPPICPMELYIVNHYQTMSSRSY